MSEIEAAGYERRRLVAAFLGRAEPLPGVLRPVAAGLVVSGILVGVEVLRRWW
ncbi:hypothetical protein [Nocardioides sp. CER19]|uniref:hypothetical protein n=1 Tax=Nocardioides sp. CER19 TaxID=3038538 RepID=UPI00244A6805|nr:hypothetical protein [Nocardioides sp. CER19]MDH2412637.1 hypothetical protein [Nocardioides sp. CER19]